jgi:hypothetical protein
MCISCISGAIDHPKALELIKSLTDRGDTVLITDNTPCSEHKGCVSVDLSGILVTQLGASDNIYFLCPEGKLSPRSQEIQELANRLNRGYSFHTYETGVNDG